MLEWYKGHDYKIGSRKMIVQDHFSFFFLYFMYVFLRPSWPGTCYTDQVGLELKEIHKALPLKSRASMGAPPHLALFHF